MKYSTIIVDLDRTLLHTDKSLSEYTIDVFKKCRNNNINIVVATARPLRNVVYYDSILNFDSMVVSNGGRLICGDKEIFYSIPQNSAFKLLSILEEYPNLKITVETGNEAYSNYKLDYFDTIVVNDLKNIIEEEGALKIVIGIESEETIKSVCEYLDDDVYYSIANGHVIQIMSKNATKWSGVREILELNNWSIHETIYFGDDNDDVDPIKNCKIGVAMSNAIDKVKEVSDFITLSNDEDGVAKYIDEKILKGI